MQGWTWIEENFANKLVQWEKKWLSLSGRLVITKLILQGINLYLMHIFYLRLTIIKELKQSFQFFLGIGLYHKTSITYVVLILYLDQYLREVGVSEIQKNLTRRYSSKAYGGLLLLLVCGIQSF